MAKQRTTDDDARAKAQMAAEEFFLYSALLDVASEAGSLTLELSGQPGIIGRIIQRLQDQGWLVLIRPAKRNAVGAIVPELYKVRSYSEWAFYRGADHAASKSGIRTTAK